MGKPPARNENRRSAGAELPLREHRVPSFTLWDATVSYQWRDWKFQVAAKNLADKEYVATCSGAYYCWYGDRRNVIGSVSYAW